MRNTLCALTVLALTLGSADNAKANRPQLGGDIRVTNTTPFAVRVRITQGPRVYRNVRLEPMESVTSPLIRLGTSKNPNDADGVNIFARGLEAPIRGETDTWFVPEFGLPQAGETQCFDVEGFLLSFPDSASIFVTPGDCNTDPEDPEETPGETPGDTTGETTGQLDTNRERMTMIASSSGLLFLAFAGYLLGRTPRRRDEDSA